MSVFTASANTCGVRIGETAEAVLPQNLRDVKITGLGAFRVLEVHHHADSIGHYSNTFKGIVSQNETLPDDHIVVPTAFPEPATVVDNADPRHQGRVKVRYFWQAHDESTNWIRVQTPDAGKSDAVAKNRGMVFIPEVGDQVMVGFIQGDPSRPYVAGSLFHRDNSKGAATDNNIKSIITRSGHTIEFNDDEKGSWGITVKDKKKNLLHIDTKDNNISVFANNNVTVTAVENMTLNAKNMLINVEEDMTTVVGGNMQTRVSGDVFLQGTNYEQYMSGDSKITNDGNLYQKSSEQVVLTDGDSVLKAKGKALMQGAQDARVSKG
jgi:uncharacterized protein involved in type VI secretion and phage assembly